MQGPDGTDYATPDSIASSGAWLYTSWPAARVPPDTRPLNPHGLWTGGAPSNSLVVKSTDPNQNVTLGAVLAAAKPPPPTPPGAPNINPAPSSSLTPTTGPSMSWFSDVLQHGVGALPGDVAKGLGSALGVTPGAHSSPAVPPGAPQPPALQWPVMPGQPTTQPGIGSMLPGFLNPFHWFSDPSQPTTTGSAVGQYCAHNPRQFMGAMVANGSLPLTQQAQAVTRPKAPCGYTLLRGTNVAILTPVARALGIAPRRRRAAVTARDLKGAMHVQKFIQSHTVHREPKTRLKNKRSRR